MILCFGGTFDPVHLGHIAAARAAAAALEAPAIRLILSARPSHRDAPGASIAQRLEMLELACAPYPELVVDDREVRRPALSYTVDTLTELQEEFPTQPIFWVIGADAYHYLPSWHRWQDVFELAHLLVLQRVGYTQAPAKYAAALADAVAPRKRALSDRKADSEPAAGYVYELPVQLPDISATGIRKRVASGYPVAHLLPSPLSSYLRAEGLYQPPTGGSA